MQRPKYRSHLNSKKWKDTRAMRVARAGYCCEHCKAHVPLQVHHLTYRSLGHEKQAELMALCGRCHETIEAVLFSLEIKPRSSGKSLKNFTSNQLRKLGITPAGTPIQPKAEHRRIKREALLERFREHRNDQKANKAVQEIAAQFGKALEIIAD